MQKLVQLGVVALAAAIAFSPVTVPAQVSSRWTVLTTTRTGTIAFDTATVDRIGPQMYEAWLRIDADATDSVNVTAYRTVRYSHVLARYGLDCSRRRIATRGMTYYDSTGSVLRSTQNDSLTWQLAIPESRGESFLREFCNTRDGTARPRTWIVAAGSREQFSPRSSRVRARDSLMIRSGVTSSHVIVIDTLRLTPAQLKAVRDFNEIPSLFRSLLAIGDLVQIPPLPAGSYRIYCETHMLMPVELHALEVLPSAPPSSTPRRP